MAEDLKEEIKYLRKRIEELEKMLATILQPFQISAEAISLTTTLASNYLTLLKLYLQHGKITPEILLPDLKDPIASEIISVLFEKREANISEIATELKIRRGKGSRATVRAKIIMLEKIGAIEKVEGKRVKYRVSAELVNKWLKLLGLVK